MNSLSFLNDIATLEVSRIHHPNESPGESRESHLEGRPAEFTPDVCKDVLGIGKESLAPFTNSVLVQDRCDDYSFRGLMRTLRRSRCEAEEVVASQQSVAAPVEKGASPAPPRVSNINFQLYRRSSASDGDHGTSPTHSIFDVLPISRRINSIYPSSTRSGVLPRGSLARIPSFLRRQSTASSTPSSPKVRSSPSVHAAAADSHKESKPLLSPLHAYAAGQRQQPRSAFYHMTHNETARLPTVLDEIEASVVSLDAKHIARPKSDTCQGGEQPNNNSGFKGQMPWRSLATALADSRKPFPVGGRHDSTKPLSSPLGSMKSLRVSRSLRGASRLDSKRSFVRASSRNEQQRQFYVDLWRWSVGRIIHQHRSARAQLVQNAVAELLILRRRRNEEIQSKRNGRRCAVASQLFGDVMRRLRSGKQRHAVLTEQRYRTIREQFALMCNNFSELERGKSDFPARMQLSLKEMRFLLEKSEYAVDIAVFRKIDRDQSGTIDLNELLHVMYPSLSIKDVKVLRRQWDGPRVRKDASAARQESRNLLSPDALDEIHRAFRQLDRRGKGVLVRSDFNSAIPNVEWQERLNLDSYFPTPTSVMTMDEFIELMKIAYPPFNTGHGVSFTLAEQPFVRTNPLPSDLLAMQDRMTSFM